MLLLGFCVFAVEVWLVGGGGGLLSGLWRVDGSLCDELFLGDLNALWEI